MTVAQAQGLAVYFISAQGDALHISHTAAFAPYLARQTTGSACPGDSDMTLFLISVLVIGLVMAAMAVGVIWPAAAYQGLLWRHGCAGHRHRL